jgi:hypothetical protein
MQIWSLFTHSELAKQQAQNTPSEIDQDVKLLTEEEVQQLAKATQILAQIAQLQQKQEEQINDIRNIQIEVLKNPEEGSLEALKETQSRIISQVG